MRTETDAASGANSRTPGPRGPEEVPPPPLRQRQIVWLGVLGWTAFVSFALWWLVRSNDLPSVWVFRESELNQPGFAEKVQAVFGHALGLQRAYPWFLFSPYLALVAWYFPLERERLRWNLPLNAAVCLAFAWACHAIDFRTPAPPPRMLLAPGTTPSGPNGSGGRLVSDRIAGNDGRLQIPGPAPEDFRRLSPRPPTWKEFLRSTILDLLAYGAVTGLAHSVNFHRRLRERERRALILESNLATARLNTLKAQLQPHFLFNSLNAITALLRRDPRLAETTLVALSELLRLALSQSERHEGTLREELEFVRRYLEIQQTRFGDKLRVEQDIEPQAMDCLVPTLVLQPLVENAIRHGIEPAEKAGVVRVSASRHHGTLVLTVEDDGVGFASGSGGSGGPVPATDAVRAQAGTGIGLANLRERLQALYGVRQKLELKPRPTGGVIVRVEIPWNPASAEFRGSNGE